MHPQTLYNRLKPTQIRIQGITQLMNQIVEFCWKESRELRGLSHDYKRQVLGWK